MSPWMPASDPELPPWTPEWWWWGVGVRKAGHQAWRLSSAVSGPGVPAAPGLSWVTSLPSEISLLIGDDAHGSHPSLCPESLVIVTQKGAHCSAQGWPRPDLALLRCLLSLLPHQGSQA